jgi:hypothetical protein
MELFHPDHLPARAWKQLWRTPELVCKMSHLPHRSTFIRVREKLSSDQIFLGLMKSPRSIHMIQSPNKMGRELDVDLNRVRRELDGFYGQKLQVRDIGIQIHMIAEILNIELPMERRLEVYLEWLKTHWEGAQTMLRRSLRE